MPPPVAPPKKEPPRKSEPPDEPDEDPGQSVPMNVMAGAIEPLQGDDPTLPDSVMASSRGKTLDGAYRLCIAQSGRVKSVETVRSVDGADESVMDALKKWKYPKLPMTVCKIQTFRFEIP